MGRRGHGCPSLLCSLFIAAPFPHAPIVQVVALGLPVFKVANLAPEFEDAALAEGVKSDSMLPLYSAAAV
jgi:hypothetical protein